MWKRNATFKRSSTSGVTKIRRDTYNTVNGFSKKNAWWDICKEVRKRDKELCVPCARKNLKVKGVEVHHIVPLSRGGKTVKSNLILVCRDCHDRRHNHLYRTRR